VNDTDRSLRPKALAIQHVAGEPPGLIGAALWSEGLALEVVRVDREEPLPKDVAGLSALVVMGGPMGVADAGRLVHLVHEMRLIESALRADIPVLGVCLGSQLLAHVLGSGVATARFLEVGWLPVWLTEGALGDPLLGGCPERLMALHWHGDAFDLPASAVHLARSERTAVQAFRHGRAWGLLFHLEADAAQVLRMADDFPGDLARAGCDVSTLTADAERELPVSTRLGLDVFGRFARIARSGPPALPL
jgi:GMP synthase (glutamine-hydrolysing)